MDGSPRPTILSPRSGIASNPSRHAGKPHDEAQDFIDEQATRPGKMHGLANRNVRVGGAKRIGDFREAGR